MTTTDTMATRSGTTASTSRTTPAGRAETGNGTGGFPENRVSRSLTSSSRSRIAGWQGRPSTGWRIGASSDTRPSPGEASAKEDVDYIQDKAFLVPGAEQAILAGPPQRLKQSKLKPPSGLPSYFLHLWTIPLLSREEEFHYFRKLHFLKYRAVDLQRELLSCRGCVAIYDEIAKRLKEAEDTRNLLVESNLRLVVSIAKKSVASSALTLDDLVSVGNAALLRAVEQFDYRRGFRFSTYAYKAIQRSIYGLLTSENRHQERFAPDVRDATQSLIKDASAADRAEIIAREARDEVRQLLSVLTSRERRVVAARFGLERDAKPRSFQNIGDEVGLSKQRVASIFSEALGKLRRAITLRKARKLACAQA